MDVDLTAEENDIIGQAIAAGHVRDAREALRQALALWVEHERRRIDLLGAIDQAEESIARGEVLTLNRKSVRDLAEDVKRRGRQRLATT